MNPNSPATPSVARLAAVLLASLGMCVAAPAAVAQGGAPSGAVATDPASAAAPSDVDQRLRQSIKSWTGGRFEAEEVRTTPLGDLFEVRIGNDLLYVDRTGRYILVEGEMVDMRTNRNLTRERMQEVLSIDFSILPLAKAMKQVNGAGKRTLVLFEDPNCTYCKRLRADLMVIDDLTVYTFAYPILAADSDLKSRKALCAPDPQAAWLDLMLYNKVADNDGRCPNALEELKALGQQLGIEATPTMFFPNGQRLQGYAPPTRLVQLLEANQAPVKTN